MNTPCPLTEAQRTLVAENIGLVGAHINRSIPGLREPTRDREWDDLFQEGCLGLAHAAAAFDPGAGITFRAFAQRRIQTAVNRALESRFQTVRLPLRKKKASADPAETPRVYPLSLDPETRSARMRHFSDRPGDSELTIGDAMRMCIDRAINESVDVLDRSPNTPDRHAVDDSLMRRIASERLSIPSESYRAPLRFIAHDAKHGNSTVVYAERRLVAQVRQTLANDVEMSVLRSVALRAREGIHAALDERDRLSIFDAHGERFKTWFEQAPSLRQGAALIKAMQWCGMDPVHLARSLYARLSDDRRVRLSRMMAPDSMAFGAAS